MTKYYYSLSGHKVKKVSQSQLINSTILELFTDPITLDYYTNPVYVEQINNIYDLESISKWLLLSSIDPSTGVVINKNKIKYYPVINIYLAMLCFELVGDQLYYYAPKGNIFDILHVAKNLYEGNKFKGTDTDVINLDIKKYLNVVSQTDYVNYSLLHCVDDKLNFVVDYYEVTLEQILNICPFTKKRFSCDTVVNNDGFFENEIYDSDAKVNKHYTGSYWMTTHTKNLNIYNMCYFTEYFDVNPKEKIIYEISDCNHYLLIDDISHDRQKKIVCNLAKCFINFEKNKSATNPRYLDGQYLQVVSHIENIYNIYCKQINNIDPQKTKVLSEIFATDNYVMSYPNNRNFISIRTFYGLYSFFDEDIIYGSDLSYITIENHNFESAQLKMVYFIGTTISNVKFINCSFLHCLFVGTKFIDCTMINCSGLSGITFYHCVPSFPKIIYN
jgi:hypothetical protein